LAGQVRQNMGERYQKQLREKRTADIYALHKKAQKKHTPTKPPGARESRVREKRSKWERSAGTRDIEVRNDGGVSMDSSLRKKGRQGEVCGRKRSTDGKIFERPTNGTTWTIQGDWEIGANLQASLYLPWRSRVAATRETKLRGE